MSIIQRKRAASLPAFTVPFLLLIGACVLIGTWVSTLLRIFTNQPSIQPPKNNLRAIKLRTKATPTTVTVSIVSKREEPTLLSRNLTVTVTADVRGNLGPPSVMTQDPPGADWIKDRWQAASDMHGSAIPGSHWVEIDMEKRVRVDKVVLDWEAAHATDYRLESSVVSPDGDSDGRRWEVLFDGSKKANQEYLRSVAEWGQSPGVKIKMPLHIVHTVDFLKSEDVDGRSDRVLRYLRVFIVRPAHGWGVSLWQVDIFGEPII